MRFLSSILLLVLTVAGCSDSESADLPQLEDEYGSVPGGLYAVGAVSQLRFEHPRATADNWTVDSDNPDVLSVDGHRLQANAPGNAELQVYVDGEPSGAPFVVEVTEAEVELRLEGICEEEGGFNIVCRRDFPLWAVGAELSIDAVLKAGTRSPRGAVSFVPGAQQSVEVTGGIEVLTATLGDVAGAFVLPVDFRIGEGAVQHQDFEMTLVDGPTTLEVSEVIETEGVSLLLWAPKVGDDVVGGLGGEMMVSLDGAEVGRGIAALWDFDAGATPQELSIEVRGLRETAMIRAVPGSLNIVRE